MTRRADLRRRRDASRQVHRRQVGRPGGAARAADRVIDARACAEPVDAGPADGACDMHDDVRARDATADCTGSAASDGAAASPRPSICHAPRTTIASATTPAMAARRRSSSGMSGTLGTQPLRGRP